MLAITNAKIETVAKGTIEKGTVLIKDGKISAVGRSVKVPPKARVINAKGKLLTPGFVDCHTHCGLHRESYPTQKEGNEKVDPLTPHIRTVDAYDPEDISVLEAPLAGVTTICALPGSTNVIGGLGAAFKVRGADYSRMLLDPAVGLKMATGENPERVYGKERQTMPFTRMGIGGMLRDMLTKAANYRARYEVPKSKKKGASLFEEDVRLDVLRRLLDKEFPARIHAHTVVDMRFAIRLAEEFGFDLVIEHCTEGRQMAEELARANVPIASGPLFCSRTKVEVVRRSVATPGILAAAGCEVAITSDHPATPLKHLRIYVGTAIAEGMSPDAALRALTIVPAKILGLEKRLGSIEKGKDADLVLWRGHPFKIDGRVERVFIDGEDIALFCL